MLSSEDETGIDMCLKVDNVKKKKQAFIPEAKTM